MYREFSGSEELCKPVAVKPRADHAKLADDVGCAVANFFFARNVVEVDPAPVLRLNDAFRAEHHAVFAGHKLVESILSRGLGEAVRRLGAPAHKDLVGVVTVVVVMLALTVVMMVMVVLAFLVVMVVALEVGAGSKACGQRLSQLFAESIEVVLGDCAFTQ